MAAKFTLPRVLSGTRLCTPGTLSIQADGLLQLKFPAAAVTCRSGLFCATQSRNRLSGVQSLMVAVFAGLRRRELTPLRRHADLHEPSGGLDEDRAAAVAEGSPAFERGVGTVSPKIVGIIRAQRVRGIGPAGTAGCRPRGGV